MDNVVGRLIYKITGDTTLLNTALSNARKECIKTGQSFDSLSKQVKSFGTKILSGVLIKQLADAASSLEELDNKFNTVFKGIEAASDAWVEKYAKATNRGQIATKEFLATQQDLRTGFGDSVESAAEFSKAVVALTNDLASFSNVRVQDAMQAVQSALAGQFEAGRRLGLGINVEIINQSKYAKAINKTWLEMNNLEKQEAVLSVALSQSKNAIHQNVEVWQDYNWVLGDAAITSGSYVNNLTGFKQTATDFAATLGDFILPTLSTLLEAGTGIMKMVNEAPQPLQVLATSIAMVGVALTALGTGPVGLILAGVSAIGVVYTSFRSTQEKLEESTANLSATTANYNETVKVLTGDTSKLSAEQKALFEVQKKIARKDAINNLLELSKKYKGHAYVLDITRQSYEDNIEAFKAYNIALTGGMPAVQKALDTIKDENAKTNTVYYETLKMLSDSGDQLQENAEKGISIYGKSALKMEADFAEASSTIESAVLTVAGAIKSGVLSVEDLSNVDGNLKQAVLELLPTLQKETDSINDNSRAIKKNIIFTATYRDLLKQIQIEHKKEQGQFVQAMVKERAFIKEKQKNAIIELAEKNNLVAAEEDITNITIAELRKRISATAEGKKELEALDAVFAKETEDLYKGMYENLQDAEEKKLTLNKIYNEKLADQNRQSLEDEAALLFYQGKAEAAFEIRKKLLEDEKLAALENLENLIKQGEATEADRVLIEQFYSNELIKLEKEKADALLSTENEKNEKRLQSSAFYNEKIKEQERNLKEQVADSLIDSGEIEEGYKIRLQLIEDEKLTEIKTLEEKIAANEAAEEDLEKLWIYYNNKLQQTNDEKNKKIEEADKKAADEEKKRWKMVASEIETTVSSVYGSLVQISKYKTDSEIAEIKRLQQAQFEALGIQEETEKEKLKRELDEAVKSGKMSVAQDKQRALDRLQIEEENQKKIDKLNYEQAKKEKELAIFNATLAMLTAVIKAFSNPGGWAGVALSSLALATGAAQIAAIQSQQLPSYAVGNPNVSEDHIAEVHRGEIIVPKSFADGLRDGDLTLGSNNSAVQITIINNTGADVSTEKNEGEGFAEYKIIIGKVLDSQFENGRYDSVLTKRYNITRRTTRG